MNYSSIFQKRKANHKSSQLFISWNPHFVWLNHHFCWLNHHSPVSRNRWGQVAHPHPRLIGDAKSRQNMARRASQSEAGLKMLKSYKAPSWRLLLGGEKRGKRAKNGLPGIKDGEIPEIWHLGIYIYIHVCAKKTEVWMGNISLYLVIFHDFPMFDCQRAGVMLLTTSSKRKIKGWPMNISCKDHLVSR